MEKRNWINGTSDIMFKTILRNNRKYLSFIVSEITKIPEDIIYNNLKYSPVEFTIDNKREKKKNIRFNNRTRYASNKLRNE